MRFLSSAQLLFKQLSREESALCSLSIAGELEDMKLLCAAPLVNKFSITSLSTDFRMKNSRSSHNLATMESFSISSTVWRYRLPNADSFEFGCENYRELNTRFLSLTDNGVASFLTGVLRISLPSRTISIRHWKHDLTAVHAFIDREKIEPAYRCQPGFPRGGNPEHRC